MLRQFLLPRKVVYADAGFDSKTGNAVIALVTADLSDSKYEFIKAASINEAELKAVEMALQRYPDFQVATDSLYAVAKSNPDKVFHCPRRENLANLIVRSATEMARSRVEHKPT